MFDLPTLVFILIIVLYALSCIKILAEYERGVIFTLGRVRRKPAGPGLILVFAPVQRMCASRCASTPWKCRGRTS